MWGEVVASYPYVGASTSMMSLVSDRRATSPETGFRGSPARSSDTRSTSHEFPSARSLWTPAERMQDPGHQSRSRPQMWTPAEPMQEPGAQAPTRPLRSERGCSAVVARVNSEPCRQRLPAASPDGSNVSVRDGPAESSSSVTPAWRQHDTYVACARGVRVSRQHAKASADRSEVGLRAASTSRLTEGSLNQSLRPRQFQTAREEQQPIQAFETPGTSAGRAGKAPLETGRLPASQLTFDRVDHFPTEASRHVTAPWPQHDTFRACPRSQHDGAMIHVADHSRHDDVRSLPCSCSTVGDHLTDTQCQVSNEAHRGRLPSTDLDFTRDLDTYRTKVSFDPSSLTTSASELDCMSSGRNEERRPPAQSADEGLGFCLSEAVHMLQQRMLEQDEQFAALRAEIGSRLRVAQAFPG